MEDQEFFEDPVVRTVFLPMKKAPGYLKICKIFAADIYQCKIFKMSLFLAKIGLILASVIQGFLFLQKFETQYFVQYGPSYFVCLYVLVCLIVQPYTVHHVTSNVDDVQVFSVESAPEAIRKKLKRIDFYVTLYILGALFTCVLFFVVCLIPTDDKHFVYVVNLVEVFLPQLRNFIFPILRLWVGPVIFITATYPVFSIVYYRNVIMAQLLLFKYCLDKINENYDSEEHIHLTNSKYHQQVTRRLNFCLKHYMQLISVGLWTVKDSGKYFFLYRIAGLLTAASTVGFYFSFQDSLSHQYARILVLALVFIVTLAGLAIGGQKVEDINEEISDVLRNVKWYHWNQSNKKSYLILLSTSVREYRIKCSENVSLNHTFSLQIINALFSVASVMYQLQVISQSRSTE